MGNPGRESCRAGAPRRDPRARSPAELAPCADAYPIRSRGSRDCGSAETPASGAPTPLDVLGPKTTSEAGRRDEDIRLSRVLLERQDDVADDEIPRRKFCADGRVP